MHRLKWLIGAALCRVAVVIVIALGVVIVVVSAPFYFAIAGIRKAVEVYDSKTFTGHDRPRVKYQ